jgi:hypothetical protein
MMSGECVAGVALADCDSADREEGLTVSVSLIRLVVAVLAVVCLSAGTSAQDDSAPSRKRSTTGPEAQRTRYLKKHATLSRDDYESLFSGPCGQRNARDCYLLAALGAIPRSQREALFRTSIKADEQGFVVSFPFGVSKSRTSIRVTSNDLGPQRVLVNGLWTSIDPVNSTDGWKALEAAYVLLIHGRDENGQVNRQAAAFGDPVAVLERIVKTNREAKIVISEGQNALAQNPRSAALVVDALNSFDPDRHMLTLGSLMNVPTPDYFIDNFHFRKGHAYVLPLVDQQNESVMLINPTDSTRPLVVGYGTMLRSFRVLRRLELDLDSTYK